MNIDFNELNLGGEMTREEVQAMIDQSIRAERKRIYDACAERIEYFVLFHDNNERLDEVLLEMIGVLCEKDEQHREEDDGKHME